MKVVRLLLLLAAVLLLAGCGGSAPAAQDPDSAALTAVLDEIRDTVQPGTAGSSLRAAQAAATLLDWAETPQAGADAAVSAWLAAQSEDVRARMPEQLESLRGMVKRLTAEYEASAGLLDDAGLTGRGPWSEEAAQTALALLGG